MCDLLFWLLLFDGGLRTSELLHIYVRDIDMERKTGMARVVLADPRDGKIAWTTATGQQQFSLRANFLARRFRKIPRHDLGAKHPERAGWKGMKYEDQQNRESFVYWSDPQAGQLFWKLHVQYMREIRLRVIPIDDLIRDGALTAIGPATHAVTKQISTELQSAL